MKKQLLFGVIMFSILFITSMNASDKGNAAIEVKKYKKIVDNLLVGLESDNEGLKLSSTFHLGEFKAYKSVIALMRILHDDANENARITAALALIKIGDARGVFQVKRASFFDESERVRRMCQKFYLDYSQKDIKS